MGNLAARLVPSLPDEEDAVATARVDIPRETDPARVEARKSRREMVMRFGSPAQSSERAKDYLYHRASQPRAATRFRTRPASGSCCGRHGSEARQQCCQPGPERRPAEPAPV